MEKMVATEWLRLAMETEEERKARLEKMVATTQLRLAEEERRARLEHLSDNPIYSILHILTIVFPDTRNVEYLPIFHGSYPRKLSPIRVT